MAPDSARGVARWRAMPAPPLEVSAERLGWIDAAGLVGMGLRTSITAVFTDDVAQGILIGGAVGLIGRRIAMASMDFGPTADVSTDSGGSEVASRWWPQLVIQPEPNGGVRRLLMFTVQDRG